MTRPDHVHRNTGLKHGPITFTIDANKMRTKVVGTTECGFRSFAYLRKDGTSLADAKRSIVTDFNRRKEK